MEMALPALDGAELFGNFDCSRSEKEQRKNMDRAAKLQQVKFDFFAWLYNRYLDKTFPNAIKSGDEKVVNKGIELKPTKSAFFTNLFYNKFRKGSESGKANGEGFTVEQEAKKEEPVNVVAEAPAKEISTEAVVIEPIKLENVAPIFAEKESVEQMAAAVPTVETIIPPMIAQELVKEEEMKPVEPVKAPTMEFAPETPVAKPAEQVKPMEPFSSVSIGTPTMENEMPTTESILENVRSAYSENERLNEQHKKDSERIVSLEGTVKTLREENNASTFAVNTANSKLKLAESTHKRYTLRISELEKLLADAIAGKEQAVREAVAIVQAKSEQDLANERSKYSKLVYALQGLKPSSNVAPVEDTTKMQLAA